VSPPTTPVEFQIQAVQRRRSRFPVPSPTGTPWRYDRLLVLTVSRIVDSRVMRPQISSFTPSRRVAPSSTRFRIVTWLESTMLTVLRPVRAMKRGRGPSSGPEMTIGLSFSPLIR
jgi:hypothetical protein